MTETLAPTQPLVVEEGDTQRGFAGTNIPRKEDKRLVQGQGVYFDDVKRHGMGYAHFVRSPYAHANIVSIDVSKAEELQGVFGTLIGEEVASLTDPFFQLSTPPGSQIRDYALAVGKTRFVGDPVAIVVAETRELARDAAELIEVEYEPLPVVADPERALEPGAPLVHPELGTNQAFSVPMKGGDVAAAFARAAHVVRMRVEHPELVAERILRYAKLVGRENVIAGVDCGFAQGLATARVHPSIMWEKFRMLSEGARLASQRLWA